ncbi:MAG: hypothetical protein RLY86_3391 [Pseudomonadota bacterium]|jgi:aspartyl-tRNA(Asn)/glutamyl-tRNA(Gln) amidotransferase subunit C
MSSEKAALNRDQVAKIAHLARIRVPDAELDHLAGELNKILDWVEMLDEVDTSRVEPMTSVAAQVLRRRADRVSDGGYPDKVVANAADAAEHFFSVPKVVE